MSSKTCSLFIVLTFFVTACSHSPTNSDISNNEITAADATADTTVAVAPDFIGPPIPAATVESPNAGEQLIWQHIAKNLTLSQFYKHPRVIQQKQKYLQDTDYLSAVSRRAEPFIYFILTEVERRQMPTELAILPIIESGYFPKARSRAKALGLWQFMSYTAKEFGLQRTRGYDGRLDVYASTTAALDYLDKLYSKFDNDWLLALAAYNAGPYRIKHALRTSTAKNNAKSYWDLQLPRETRKYIPKLLALSSIVNDNILSKSLLHPIADESYIETIEVNKRISPKKLVQVSGVNATELKLLNPVLRNLSIQIPPGYRLLAPKHDARLLATTIDSLPAEALLIWEEHKITYGDSLSTIAERYDTSVSSLRAANNLNGDIILAGQTLIIPAFGNTHKQSTSRKTRANKGPTKPTGADAPYFYVVTPGDSLWKIARRNNTSVERLAIINDKHPNQPLRPGESILID